MFLIDIYRQTTYSKSQKERAKLNTDVVFHDKTSNFIS